MDTTVLLQQKEEKLSSSPGNSSANEKPPHLELPVYSSGRLICNSLFQLPPFSLKTGGSPLVSRTCLQFCYSLSVPDCNSRSSLDEPIFYRQNNRQFLFLGSTKAMGSFADVLEEEEQETLQGFCREKIPAEEERRASPRFTTCWK